jgi:hypothetical protein
VNPLHLAEQIEATYQQPYLPRQAAAELRALHALLAEVLRAIEEGEPFTHFDNVIGPALREKLK